MKLYQLGQLFALPLQSAIRAQNLAIQETISFIENFGLEKGVAKTFQFKAERIIEEQKVDQESKITETKFKVQPFQVSIPILALASPPSMYLQEMSIEFGVEVTEPKSEPIKSSVIPSSVLGHSLAPSLGLIAPLGQSNPTTMKVNMKIVKEISEGVARLGDLLTNLISGQATEDEMEVPPLETLPSVKKISGIGKERANLLKAMGILTVKDFYNASETKEKIKVITETLGVSVSQVKEWRKKARLLIIEK
jgi:hypothetical protein